MILDIPPHMEQSIVQISKNQGISANELIMQWLHQAVQQAQNQSEELDFVGMWADQETSVDEQMTHLRKGRTF